MKIAQLLLPSAPLYERKTWEIDARTLRQDHEILTWFLGPSGAARSGVTQVEAPNLEGLIDLSGVSILQVYGPWELPADPFSRLDIPYVANGIPRRSLLPWRAPRLPARHVLPFGPNTVPEAVDDRFFSTNTPRQPNPRYRIGSMDRASTSNMVQATTARLARFRDDVDWQVWQEPPSPDQLAAVDLWVDPTRSDTDLDGYVAEALVCGVPVVAAKTEVNRERLGGGRAGFLVPPGDPNEMTHAIVSALFKPELCDPRLNCALETRDRFRAHHRARRLLEIYSELIR